MELEVRRVACGRAYVHQRLTGHVALPELQAVRRAALVALGGLPACAWLFDASEANLDFTAFVAVRDSGVGEHAPVALVVEPELYGCAMSAAAVMARRGILMMPFTSPAGAAGWAALRASRWAPPPQSHGWRASPMRRLAPF